jgi:hypothetical protein
MQMCLLAVVIVASVAVLSSITYLTLGRLLA